MDVLLSMPEEFLRHLLLKWFDLSTIAQLDTAYISRNSRPKLLSLVSDPKFAFIHEIWAPNTAAAKQVKVIQWLVRRACRVKRVVLSIEIQPHEELLTEFFQLSGSSMHTIKINNKTHVPTGDFLWTLLLAHCHYLQELSVKECFPENPDFLYNLSLRCPCICKLILSPHLMFYQHTLNFPQGLHFRKLRCLDLAMAHFSSSFLSAIAPESTQLEVLTLASPMYISMEPFAAIALHCPLLHTISLIQIHASDEELQPLFTLCKNLLKLDVVGPGDTFTDLSLSCIAQNCLLLNSLCLHTCLRVTNDGLCDILKYCTNLRTFSLRSNIRLTDATLYSIASFCPLLTHLSLRGRFSYSIESLTAIAQSCTKLQMVLVSTGRRNLNVPFQDIFGLHVKVVVTVERQVFYNKEKSDEEHAKFIADRSLANFGFGDY